MPVCARVNALRVCMMHSGCLLPRVQSKAQLSRTIQTDPNVLSAALNATHLNQLRQQIIAVKFLTDGEVLPVSLLKSAVSVNGGMPVEAPPRGYLGNTRGRGRGALAAAAPRGRGRGRGCVDLCLLCAVCWCRSCLKSF